MPGVDEYQGRQRTCRIAEEAARTGQAPVRQVVAEEAVVGGKQGSKDQADDDRGHRHRDEEKGEADALEEAVAPEKQRQPEPEHEFDRDRRDGERRGGDDRIPRRLVGPQRPVIVEADEGGSRRP